jgi:hypothetical protein
MGNKNIKSSEEQNSTSSVFNLSLESNKEKNQHLLIKDNDSDIVNDLKNEVDLPIENELIESSEISLEGKEEEFKIKFFFEKFEDNILEEGLKRSKTYAPQISIKNTPKPHPLESNVYISPLKLSVKSFGNIPKFNKKPNAVLYDFQKNIIDSKSCNDEDSLDDFFLGNTETERTTPNVEDLQDLLNCRKKMNNFRNSIDQRLFNEYENILNSDYMFEENRELNKKNNFWFKHIKQQKLKNKISNEHNIRIGSEPLVKISDNDYDEEKDENEHGLFILGILESAAKERKGRNTVNV